MYTFNISESPKPFYIEIQHNTNIFIGGFAVTNNLSDIMLLLVNSKGEEFSKKYFRFQTIYCITLHLYHQMSILY